MRLPSIELRLKHKTFTLSTQNLTSQTARQTKKNKNKNKDQFQKKNTSKEAH